MNKSLYIELLESEVDRLRTKVSDLRTRLADMEDEFDDFPKNKAELAEGVKLTKEKPIITPLVGEVWLTRNGLWVEVVNSFLYGTERYAGITEDHYTIRWNQYGEALNSSTGWDLIEKRV